MRLVHQVGQRSGMDTTLQATTDMGGGAREPEDD